MMIVALLVLTRKTVTENIRKYFNATEDVKWAQGQILALMFLCSECIRLKNTKPQHGKWVYMGSEKMVECLNVTFFKKMGVSMSLDKIHKFRMSPFQEYHDRMSLVEKVVWV